MAMEIRIRDNAYGHIGHLAGQWVEVDTDFLFSNQFNTVPMIDGNGNPCNGFRVMESDVIGVRNDMREGRARCYWCGKHSIFAGKLSEIKETECVHCEKSGYLKDLTPRKVSYQKHFSRRRFIVKIGGSLYYLRKGEGMGGFGEPENHPLKNFEIVEVRGGHEKGWMSIDEGRKLHSKIDTIVKDIYAKYERELEVQDIVDNRK